MDNHDITGGLPFCKSVRAMTEMLCGTRGTAPTPRTPGSVPASPIVGELDRLSRTAGEG
jgi:hypothetical protein